MKNKLAIIVIMVAALAILLPADYGANLSNAPTHWTKHPIAHQLANGNIIVLWSEGEEERNAEIVYRVLDTQTMVWGPKLQSVGRIFSTQFAQVVEDHEGVLHMAFMDGNARQNRDIWYANYDYRKPVGEQWSVKERVALTREQSAWQRISIDPVTEDLYASYQHVYEYAANENWESNIVVHRKAKDPVTGLYGDWSEDVKMSRRIEDKSIHQATWFTGGKLHGVYEEGHEGGWKLTYNYVPGGANYAEGAESTVRDIPGASIPAYWPEIEADSKGNLYCVWSQRSMETKGAFKPVDGEWRDLGTLIFGSTITMIGMKVARNDVAYVIHNQGYSGSDENGVRPVFVRFTDTNVSSAVPIRDTGRGQRVLEIEVDQNGAVHAVWSGPYSRTSQAHMSTYYERVPQVGGPQVSISAPAVVLTNEDVEFQGNVTSSSSPILKHRFYCRNARVWGGEDDSSTYTMRFTKEGFYTVHYYVADSQNLMGHAAITIEAVDAPFQPTGGVRSTDIVRGLLFRAWINKISWKSDSRNVGKFENLTHFNIYKRNVGSNDWGQPITEVAYVDANATYDYKGKTAFMSQDDAEGVEYAVTLVALVNNQEKESRKTVL